MHPMHLNKRIVNPYVICIMHLELDNFVLHFEYVMGILIWFDDKHGLCGTLPT